MNVLDFDDPLKVIAEVAEEWLSNYGEVETYFHGERGCVQFDHGHEEYEKRMDLIVALREWLGTR